MAEIVPGTPLATSLQNVVQPKLVEMGWTSGDPDDLVLAEYVMMLLSDGKTPNQIATELSTEFLTLQADDPAPALFGQWLFEQVSSLTGQNVSQSSQSQSSPGFAQLGQEDAEMGDAAGIATSSTIPTGPKSMRNGLANGRDKRILGQVNKTLNRGSEASLHKIKGASGTGRINTHNRETPRGPAPKGPRNLRDRNAQMHSRPTNGMNLNAMNPMDPSVFMASMTPQQQMQVFAMYEEQARRIAEHLSPHQQQQAFAMGMMGQGSILPPQDQQQQQGKSLFDRVQSKPQRFNKRQQQTDHEMSDGTYVSPTNPTSSMEVEEASQSNVKTDANNTVCIWNLKCTRDDCAFVHQSPAAPPGVTIDMTDTCTFGAACMNRKCVGKHPSPAKRTTHAAEQECRFYPNCTKPDCPYRHPSMPPCRNGADCGVPNCKFFHNKTPCSFHPCTKPSCPFKHAEGQKGFFKDKTWSKSEAEGNNEQSSNSDKAKGATSNEWKFEVDDGEEELILPAKQESENAEQVAQTVPAVEVAPTA